MQCKKEGDALSLVSRFGLRGVRVDEASYLGPSRGYSASVEVDTNRVQSALCTRMRIVFYAIRLGPNTSVYEMNVNVVSTVTGCDVTYCATT